MQCPPEGDTFSLPVMAERTEATLNSSQPCGLHEDGLVQGELCSVVRLSKYGPSMKGWVMVTESGSFRCGLVKTSLRTEVLCSHPRPSSLPPQPSRRGALCRHLSNPKHVPSCAHEYTCAYHREITGIKNVWFVSCSSR